MPAKPDERRREGLLDDLGAIMLEEGFSDWRVGKLAERLHCSRSTLYKLAPSKDELVLLLIDTFVIRALAAAKAEADALTSPADAVIRYTQTIQRWQKKGSPRFWADVMANPATQSLIEDVHAIKGASVVQGYLDQGVAAGLFRPARTDFIATVIWRSARLTRDPGLLESLGLQIGEAWHELGQFIVYGMGWPPGEGKAGTKV